LEVPAEGYTGWQTAEVEISRDKTALVVMHAWDAATYEEYPGWWKAVEYIPRANEICRTVFPPVLEAVRESGMTVLHVVGGADYYKQVPGYLRAVELAGPAPPPPPYIPNDPVLDSLRAFRADHSSQGPQNRADCSNGMNQTDFPAEARPLDSEGVAENDHQLFALCEEAGINHLIYMGFAINWCILLSPGGMHDMQRRGFMCSALRQATTAVENKESARRQTAKEIGLWRVAVAYGFVFDVDPFVAALKANGS
jgi:hypothetical protein